MNKNKRTHLIPLQGQFIEVTSRKCSDNVQPNIKTNKIYVVDGNDTLNDGTVVLLLHNAKNKRQPYRINAQRFDWQIITEEMVRERNFKEKCKKSTLDIQNKFTFAEHIYIAFVPLIYANLAFHYGMKCKKYCVDNRLNIFKKLSRTFDEVLQKYDKEVGKDLDGQHQKQIYSETRRFMETYKNDFLILWQCVKRELLKKAPNHEHLNLKTDAISGIQMIKLYNEHNKNVDAMIASRLGGETNSVENPLINTLYTILEAYSGEVKNVNIDENDIRNARFVIKNKVKQIEFNITK